MKKIALLKKLRIQCRLLIWMLLLLPVTYQAKAQFVELPDTNFRNELRNLYPECFNASGFLDTTCASVVNENRLEFNNNKIKYIDGIEYFKALRSLIILANDIDTLRNLPKDLDSLTWRGDGFQSFYGDFCIRKSIDFPQKLSYVNLDEQVFLKSLPILPPLLEFLSCRYCDLEFIEGFNQSIIEVDLFGNENLKCLPDIPESMLFLNLQGTEVRCLANIPANLSIDATQSIEICQSTCEQYLSLYEAEDPNFQRLLEVVRPYNLINGKIDTLKSGFTIMPNNFLNLSGINTILSLDGLQYIDRNWLEIIFCEQNQIDFLPDLHNHNLLSQLYIGASQLQQILQLPESIKMIDVIGSLQLTCLPRLPIGLETLWIDNTGITCLPNLVISNDVNNLLPLCTDTLAICDFRRCDSTLCVLPGDADHDRTVNNFDIFAIGLSYNRVGQERPAGSQEYVLQPTLEWNTTHHYGYNDKFADCNGDGIINDADALVVDDNYIAQAQNVYSYRQPQDDSIPPVFLLFESTPTFTFNGTCNVAEVVADIMVGTPTNGVDNIYGMAFSVEYPEEFVSPDCMSVTVELDEDSWFQTNNPILLFYKNIPEFHRVDIAITRTDGQPRSGNGRVGKIKLITEGDIFGVHRGGNYTFDFDVKDVAGVDTIGKQIVLNGQPVTQEFIVTQIASPKIEDLRMYPNPAADALRVQAKETISSIRVYDITGNLLMEQTGGKNDYTLNLKDLAPGILMVEIRSENAVEFVRVVKR